MRWTIKSFRQPQETLSKHRDGSSGSRAHCASHAILSRILNRRNARFGNCPLLRSLLRTTLISASLRLSTPSAQVRTRQYSSVLVTLSGNVCNRRTAAMPESDASRFSSRRSSFKSVTETIGPKLVDEDVPLLTGCVVILTSRLSDDADFAFAAFRPMSGAESISSLSSRR